MAGTHFWQHTERFIEARGTGSRTEQAHLVARP